MERTERSTQKEWSAIRRKRLLNSQDNHFPKELPFFSIKQTSLFWILSVDLLIESTTTMLTKYNILWNSMCFWGFFYIFYLLFMYLWHLWHIMFYIQFICVKFPIVVYMICLLLWVDDDVDDDVGKKNNQ